LYSFYAHLAISLQQNSSKIFNLTNPRFTSWKELFAKLCSLGYVFEQISYAQWRDELSLQPENVLYPILSALPKTDGFATPTLPSKHKLEEFIGDDWPMIDDKLLDVYFSYFWESGFLDKPSAN